MTVQLNWDAIMKQWDRWRGYIAKGGTASWPRDAFENLVCCVRDGDYDLPPPQPTHPTDGESAAD